MNSLHSTPEVPRSRFAPLFKKLAFFASLKMAVINIALIACSLATATVLESIYDTATGRYWVYRAPWFSGLLALFALNLAAVMVDRWPWKRSHAEFLLAHVGILMLLAGGWVTGRYGVDGTLQLAEGETSGVVDLPDEYRMSLITPSGRRLSRELEWLPPHRGFKPRVLSWDAQGDDGELPKVEWSGFLSHADVETSPEAEGGTHEALKLLISGGPMRLHQEVWLWGGDPSWSQMQMGPAEFVLLPSSDWPFSGPGVSAATPGRARLEVVTTGSSLKWNAISIRGEQRQGKIDLRQPAGARAFQPGWMDLTVQVLEWLPKAKLRSAVKPARIQYGEQAPSPAIQVKLPSTPEKQWLALGERGVWKDSQGRSWQVVFHTERVYLPFGLKLKRFQIEHDPGTQNPASFGSEVIVQERLGKDADASARAPAWIKMNAPLEFKGFTFYQASYVPGIPRPTISIFSVNRDPGRTLKYLGSIILVLGSALLFWRKVRMQRMNVADSVVGKTLLIALAMLGAGLFADARAELAPRGGAWSFQTLGQVPVQSGGRFKPLDTLARDTVLSVTGSRNFENWPAVEIMLSWMMDPKAWNTENLIRVGHPDVRRQLLLEVDRTKFSLKDLIENSVLGQYAQSRANASPENRSGKQVGVPSGKRDLRDQELNRVLDRIQRIRTVVSGEWLTIVPTAEPASGWKSVSEDPEARTRWIALLQAYGQGDRELFQRVSEDLLTRGMAALQTPEQNRVKAEFAYNRFQLFHFAMIAYLAAGLVWILSRRRSASPWLRRAAFLLTVVGFAAHLAGFALRCYVAGRPPVSNMYESVIWVAFGALFFAGVLYSRLKNTLLLAVGTWVAGLVLLSADASPLVLDPTIQPLMPVLRSNYWLTIHVLTITASYAAFALCMGMGNIALGLASMNRWKSVEGFERRFQVLNQLNYRAMQIGVVLLAAGTILGGVWADESWGRFWGWDPKEVWALTALLVYLAILHGRYTGWIRGFGYALSSVLGFLSVVMAWYGVNFVLGVGLHSYGFSTGGLSFMAAFCALQLCYAAATWVWVKTGSGGITKRIALVLIAGCASLVLDSRFARAETLLSDLEASGSQIQLQQVFVLSRSSAPVYRNFFYDPGFDVESPHHYWDLRCARFKATLPLWLDHEPRSRVEGTGQDGAGVWSPETRRNPQARLQSVALIEVASEVAMSNTDGGRYELGRLESALQSAHSGPGRLCSALPVGPSVMPRQRAAGRIVPEPRALTLWDDVFRYAYLRGPNNELTNLSLLVHIQRFGARFFWLPLRPGLCEAGHIRGAVVQGQHQNILTPRSSHDSVERSWTELFATGESENLRARHQFCAQIRENAFMRLVERCGAWQVSGIVMDLAESVRGDGIVAANRLEAIRSTCESIQYWGEPWISRYRTAVAARVAILMATSPSSVSSAPTRFQIWNWRPRLFSEPN